MYGLNHTGLSIMKMMMPNLGTKHPLVKLEKDQNLIRSDLRFFENVILLLYILPL